MNLVYNNRKEKWHECDDQVHVEPSENKATASVLKSWLMANASPTVKKFHELEKGGFKKKLNFTSKKLSFQFVLFDI